MGVSDDTIRKGCRTALALIKLVEDFRLDVLSLLSQYNIQLLADNTAGYGSSLLIENGFMVSCEGDVATLVMMDVLYQFAGISPMYGEYSLYDLKKNAFYFAHHGDGDPNLAENLDKVILTSCPETWGCKEALAFEFTMLALKSIPQSWKELTIKSKLLNVDPMVSMTFHTSFSRLNRALLSFTH